MRILSRAVPSLVSLVDGRVKCADPSCGRLAVRELRGIPMCISYYIEALEHSADLVAAIEDPVFVEPKPWKPKKRVTLPPIGARLREVRKQRGMKLRQLPWLNKNSSDVETGKCTPTLARVERWCDVLGITPQDLFASEENWLLRDPFIGKSANELLNLTLAQRAQVLEVLEGL